MRRSVATVFVILSVGGALAVAVQLPPARRAPPPGVTATSSGTRVISPVALVTWVTTVADDGTQLLNLIVLWRGSPGWFSRGSGSGTSGGGSGSSFHSTIRYGGLDLQLEFESKTRLVQIQGRRVDLHDDNVILVDDVDAGGEPRVAGTCTSIRRSHLRTMGIHASRQSFGGLRKLCRFCSATLAFPMDAVRQQSTVFANRSWETSTLRRAPET